MSFLFYNCKKYTNLMVENNYYNIMMSNRIFNNSLGRHRAAITLVLVFSFTLVLNSQSREKEDEGNLDFDFKVEVLRQTEPDSNRVKLAYASDGYTGDEINTFPGHVKNSLDYLMTPGMYVRPLPRYKNFINVYEGAIYASNGAYRPSKNSKMGWTSDRKPVSFNAVCRQKIILDIYDIVDPVDEAMDNGMVHVQPSEIWLKVVDPAVLLVDWYINGKLVKED